MQHFWDKLPISGTHFFCAHRIALIFSLRFTSVTDRFLSELASVTNAQVSKDGEVKYENLVRGLRHIKIKVRNLVLLLVLHERSPPGLAVRII
jgi:hypothetical protein